MNFPAKQSQKPTADSSESSKRIYDFLTQHPIGTLATVDSHNNPCASVIYYMVDEEFNITFTTKRDTKKHANIQRNSHVELAVYQAASQTTAQITGVATEITDVSESNEAFSNTLRAAIRTSEAGVPPISKLYAGPYTAYKITPNQIRMAVFIRPDSGGFDMYETLNF